MRRLPALLMFVLFLLTACGCGRRAHFLPAQRLSADFTLTRGEYTVMGHAVCAAEKDVTFTFTAPEGLRYLTVRVAGDEITAEVYGVRDNIPAAALPAAAPLLITARALSDALFCELTYTRLADGTYTAETPAAACRFSPDGALTELTFAEQNIRVTFSE